MTARRAPRLASSCWTRAHPRRRPAGARAPRRGRRQGTARELVAPGSARAGCATSPRAPATGVEHPGPHRGGHGRGLRSGARSRSGASASSTRGSCRPRVRAGHVVFAVIDLAALLGLAPLRSRVRSTSIVCLPIERDIALVVPARASQPARSGESSARPRGGRSPVGAACSTSTQGPPLGAREVSLAYRLRFEPVDGRRSDDAKLDGRRVRSSMRFWERLGARLRA